MIGGTTHAGYLTTALLQPDRSGKRSLPVRPSHSYYARFKHVIGVPAGKGSDYVPLHKLRVLDNLISHLIGVRSHSAKVLLQETFQTGDGKVSVDAGNVDKLIADVTEELKTTGSAGYSVQGAPNRGPMPETGTVVDFLA